MEYSELEREIETCDVPTSVQAICEAIASHAQSNLGLPRLSLVYFEQLSLEEESCTGWIEDEDTDCVIHVALNQSLPSLCETILHEALHWHQVLNVGRESMAANRGRFEFDAERYVTTAMETQSPAGLFVTNKREE